MVSAVPDKGKVLDQQFLAEYAIEASWAEEYGVCKRTVARYRADGLPYLTFAGVIWIHKRGGREWIADRIRQRNRRRQRQPSAI
jgi:hypothetical protein